MLFDELQDALAARLNGDSYFSEAGKVVPVIGENRLDLVAEYNAALNRCGACGVVSVSAILDGDVGTEVVVNILSQFHEMVALNRETTMGGTGKRAFSLGVKAMALFGHLRWTPDENQWSPLHFKGLELTEVDEEHGIVIWSLRHETRTDIETVFELLAQSDETILVTESGLPLLVSPSEP